MSLRLSGVAGVVGVLTVSAAQAVLVSNFESPTYTADVNPAGTDGWVTYGGGGNITPTSGGYTAAYGAVPQGSQSLLSGSGGSTYIRAFPTGVSLADGTTVDWLYWQEIQAGASVVGLADAIGSANPVAAVGVNAAGNFQLIGAGSVSGATDTGIAADYGASANADHYRISIVLDTTNQEFDAYATKVYPSLGSPVFLGTKAFGLAPSDSGLASVGGTTGATSPAFVMYRGGNSYFAIDDININAVPEPASIGLLGLSVASMLRRRAR